MVSVDLISQLANQPGPGASFSQAFDTARINRLSASALRGEPGALEDLARVNPRAAMEIKKSQDESALKKAQGLKAEADRKAAQAQLFQTDQETFANFFDEMQKMSEGLETIEEVREVLGPREKDFYRAYKETKGIDLTEAFGPAGEFTEAEVASFMGKDPKVTGDFQTYQIIGTDQYKTVNEASPEGQEWIAENADRIRKAPLQREEGGPRAFEGGTKKDFEKLREVEIATTNAITNAYRLQDLIREDPDALTATGRMVSIARAMANEAEAVARTFGVEIPEGLNDAARYASTFETLGVDNARARGMITNLAYTAAAANGQTGRGVSDRDVKRFIERIGGGYMDPQARDAVLDDFIEEIAEAYKVRHSVINPDNPYTGTLGLRGARGAEQPTATPTREQWKALPSGTPYIDPNGKRRIKK